MIEIDGSEGEGGGQILRSSLTLSMLTGRAFRLTRVRANRPKPGLAAQHLTCVRAAAAITGADVKGASLGSVTLEFVPGAVRPGKYTFSVGTAGATALVLQTVALPLAHAATRSEVTIQGGTHVAHAPCFHYLETTWAAYLRETGHEVALTMGRAGFYPRGGGEVHAIITPVARARGLRMTRRDPVTAVTVFSAVAGELPVEIARRQARRAETRLKELGVTVTTALETWPNGPGSFVALTAGGGPVPTMVFALGERGTLAERVADEAYRQFAAWHATGCPVDPHAADQVLLPLVLAPEESSFAVSEVTQHLLTNVATLGHFVDRAISVEGKKGATGVVRVEARGL